MYREHLAGIVPVSNEESGFGLKWHDCLMPVADNFLAIQNAVFECALAGCDTIWVVSRYEDATFLKEILGEWILDPVDEKRYDDDYSVKRIPIYYVPIKPRDMSIGRTSISWAAIHGVFMAFRCARGISKWIVPRHYYVSFANKVCDTSNIVGSRKIFKGKIPVLVTCNEKSILTGDLLSFTINHEAFLYARRKIRVEGEKDISKIFGIYSEIETKTIVSNWYYRIDNWKNYSYYMSDQLNYDLDIPKQNVLKSRKW